MAAAAPETGGAGAALLAATIGLLALLAYYAVRGILAGWQATIGRAFLWLAEALTFNIPTGFTNIHVSLGGPFKAVNNAVVGWLGAFAEKLDGYAGLFFHGSAVLVHWTAQEIRNTATDVLGWGKWLQQVFTPTLIRGYTDIWKGIAKTAGKLAHFSVTQFHHLERIVSHTYTATTTTVYRLPKSLDKRLGKDENWLKALTVGLAALAGGIAIQLPHKGFSLPDTWRGLTKRLARIERRLARLEKLLGAAGMAAVMANALGLPNWRCITRGNLGRLSRYVCGLPTWLLGLIIYGTVEAFIITDLCGFTDLLIKEAEAIRPTLYALVDVEDALIGCHGTVKPPDLNLPPLSLPPMYGPSALAA